MFKLVLENAEEPEIKLPTPTGSSKKQESSRKTSTSALLTTPKPLTMWITRNWKILKEMGISDYLTCFLRNQYEGQEVCMKVKFEPDMEQQTGPNWERRTSPCLFNLYAKCIMRNARLDESQTGIKIDGRNINNLRYTDDTTLMAESKEDQRAFR